MPGYLFKYRRFKESFETPIVKEESEASLERLKKNDRTFCTKKNKERGTNRATRQKQ